MSNKTNAVTGNNNASVPGRDIYLFHGLQNIAVSIKEGAYDAAFKALYPQRETGESRERYLDLLNLFSLEYGGSLAAAQAAGRAALFSAPGRTEICGNHTDHQHGNVLAAAIDLDIICAAVTNGSNIIRIKSSGHDGISVDLGEQSLREDERGDAASLIRGMAARLSELGVAVGGFDAYTTSNVLVGSGLSSSAAFEVVAGTAMNVLFDGGLSPLDIAKAGQYAENQYFGKPSGLMDQTASSVGGFVQIDFASPESPIVSPVQCDLSAYGLRLCVVNTKGSHADLIGEYASIPAEMLAVASYYGKRFLHDVDEGAFMSDIGAIREHLHNKATGENSPPEGGGTVAPDRAILRAMHFFRENKLVTEAAGALRAADVGRFLDCVVRSGQSSFNYLQNIFATGQPGGQGMSIALALSESLLRGSGGAWRVHGGGFAGTIMAFVPDALLGEYKRTLEAVFGEGSCITLTIRSFGGVEVTPDLGA
ncbi:MAG: galactokinase [Oscillospiraceae bacterium]|nr:galactokinase [Oscillospiraceae bacterium]